MEIRKCMGCMSDIAQTVCPHCGFSLSQYQKPKSALDCGIILNGRYLLGAAEETASSLRYSAFDLELEKTVEITEFFPADQAVRPSGNEVQPKSDFIAFGNAVKHFEITARRASALNTVRWISHVQDVFWENGTCCCVTDRWSGQTLQDTVRQTGPLKWKQAQRVFAQAAKTLEAVHRAGFVHCSLNPENLILTDKGAVIRLDPDSLCELSKGGHPSARQDAYTAPELFGASEAAGAWTDVYSLAATMYYALTGTLPPGVQARVVEDRLCFDLPVLQKIPRRARSVMQQALCLEPEGRPESMARFREGISHHRAAGASGEKHRRKKYGIVIGAAALILVAGSVLTLQIIRHNRYQAAGEAYRAGNYAQAAAAFERLSGYKDAEEMAGMAVQHLHYEAGLLARQEKRYADAAAEFAGAPDVPGVTEQLGESCQLLGKSYLEKKAYEDAVAAFSRAEACGIKDADVYVSYADGMNDLEKKDYPAAIEKLTKAAAVTKDLQSPVKAYGAYIRQLLKKGEYENAETTGTAYVRFCTMNNCDGTEADELLNGAILEQAEALYDSGRLAEAQKTFERAAEGTEYNGINRDARLKKLSKHAKLITMEGDWHTVSGKSTLSSGGWIYYYDLSKNHRFPFTIRFVLNDDDTITASGSCTWLSCENLLTTKEKTFTFSSAVKLNYLHLTGVDSIRNNVTLTLVKDTLRVGFTSKDGTSVQYVYEKGK